MKIALACGGTGGHIFPGLATAVELQRRGHEVVLWLAGKDIERPAIWNWEGPVITVHAEGLPHGFSLRAVRAGWKLLCAAITCTRLMRRNRPDILLAMGSYASVGPLCAALWLNVPMVLHEANVLPGRAILLFSRWATVAGSFEETRYYLRRKKNLEITGMPIRQNLEEAAQNMPARTFEKQCFTILVMGGSRGAHRLNDIVSNALCRVHGRGQALRVIHLTGVADEAFVRETYRKAGLEHEVYGFAQDMASLYSKTDLAICRSGAATCAELSTFGIPALFVPYPFAARNHQTANAKALERIGAADVVPESDLSVSWLVDYISGSLANSARLARMSSVAGNRTVKSGAQSLATLVEQVRMQKG